MINIKNVSYTYPKSYRRALDGVNAEIPCGIHLLVGENGAGKSTLLYAIAGLISPQSGSVDVNSSPATSPLPSARREVFMLDENLKITQTSIKKFASVHSCFYTRFSNDVFLSNLKDFGLSGEEPIRRLSLGNRKKTLLAYVLALGVDVLLLDEPTNGLDIQSKDTLRRLIASQTVDTQTIIISTHNVAEFHNFYDGFISLHKGKLQLAATSEQISELLEFSVGNSSGGEILYSELGIGGRLCISTSTGQDCTDIDWQLLYKSLSSPAGRKIISLFSDNK